MHPGVGKHVTFVPRVRFTAQRFAGFDEIINAALPLREVRAIALVNAVGNPIYDERLGPRVHRCGKGFGAA